MSRYRIGIDVGGTFTDLVAVDDDGRITATKALSTPADQSIGVLDGLDRLSESLGLDRAALLAATDRIVHGTTVATNALLEGKGARVGLLTTEGHRDIIEMREGLKDDRYALRQPAPEPLVPRRLRLPVRERVRADGSEGVALGRRSLQTALATLREAGVEAVAVCYLHSYRAPSHERATGAAIARALPDAYVSLSCDVFPQIKEYERVCTTVVNAYVGPALDRYLNRLVSRLAEAGYVGPLLIMQSHGGLAPVADAVRLAAGAVLSGPAGGVAAMRHAARLLHHGDLIGFDMGGTSTDMSLVVDGEASVSTDRRVAGQRVALHSLDIASIGAGGGSIAHVDAGGVLHVGPRSAGAEPGPACYGRGGEEATVTDANLVLGFLDAEGFLGGRHRLDVAAATRAVDAIAGRLRIDRMAAAEGIHRIVNTRMAEGIRLVSVRRGVDPRRFALLSFGGAAGAHVTDVARQLDLTRVIVPTLAPMFSAWGMLASNLRYELTRTHIGDASRIDGAGLDAVFREMEAQGRARLAEAAFDGPVRCRRSADMRYGEQIFEVEVPLDGVDWSGADPMRAVADAFHERHEALYTYSLRDQEAVLVNARLAVVGVLPDPPAEPPRPARPDAPHRALRPIYLGRWIDVPVHDLDALAPGQRVEGPAIVESQTTTVVLRTGDRAHTTALGWLDIEVGAR
ncbi:MAG: hydantoinase/oxoprolinase family protein [Ectothiorhodospiraceae bacterium]|nr:hydantoinase/oxoprolinase family protein [Ectothiorhodospiraceae bacterium]